jgi:L-amino acid N-acyltransferase YncA
VNINIERMMESDWPVVATIYREGIRTGDATFEGDVPEWKEWNTRHLQACRLVAKAAGQIVGWVVLSPVSSRCVYAGVAEVSVYVKASMRGKGIGKALLAAAIEGSELAGIWTLQSGIFPENMASLAVHRECGFRLVGYRERIGQMHGVWRDVVLMERRSKVVGV